VNIIVTGGAGFIGSNVVDEYVRSGHQVIVIDNLSSGSKDNLNPTAKFYEMDIRDEKIADVFAPDKPDGMIRDYVYVKDIVQANVSALEKGNLKAFNIGTGKEVTTGQLYREIADQMKVNVEPIKGEAQPGDIRRSCLNFDKAKTELDWKPQYTLQKGIAETIQYFTDKK